MTEPDERTQRLIDPSVMDRIQGEIQSDSVVLFMNGTPAFPQCSASAQAAQILSMLGVRFKHLDVTTEPSIRLAIKDFSNWPLLPQLYVNAHFVGGNDIMRQMLEDGSLISLFERQGIPLSLPS